MYFEDDFFRLESPKLTESEKIKMSKEYSESLKNAREKAKLDRCLLCNKTCTSFCNSHTIPQFIMKELSKNGNYFCMNTLIGMPTSKQIVGTKEAITFHTICNECDQIYFRTYENPDSYLSGLSQKLLAEVALKNNLRLLSKKIIENEMLLDKYKNIEESSFQALNFLEAIETNELDIKETLKSIELAKDTIKGKKDGYYLIDYIKLDYVAKMAFQSKVALVCGFDGELINDIYYKNAKYKIQCLHISVFPMKGGTYIFLFIENGDKRYSKFYKHYRKLSLDEKLKVVNYIILKYSEEWLLSSNIEKTILNNKGLSDAVRTISIPKPRLSFFGGKDINELELKNELLSKAISLYSLKNLPDIPNFLKKD